MNRLCGLSAMLSVGLLVVISLSFEYPSTYTASATVASPNLRNSSPVNFVGQDYDHVNNHRQSVEAVVPADSPLSRSLMYVVSTFSAKMVSDGLGGTRMQFENSRTVGGDCTMTSDSFEEQRAHILTGFYVADHFISAVHAVKANSTGLMSPIDGHHSFIDLLDAYSLFEKLHYVLGEFENHYGDVLTDVLNKFSTNETSNDESNDSSKPWTLPEIRDSLLNVAETGKRLLTYLCASSEAPELRSLEWQKSVYSVPPPLQGVKGDRTKETGDLGTLLFDAWMGLAALFRNSTIGQDATEGTHSAEKKDASVFDILENPEFIRSISIHTDIVETLVDNPVRKSGYNDDEVIRKLKLWVNKLQDLTVLLALAAGVNNDKYEHEAVRLFHADTYNKIGDNLVQMIHDKYKDTETGHVIPDVMPETVVITPYGIYLEQGQSRSKYPTLIARAPWSDTHIPETTMTTTPTPLGSTESTDEGSSNDDTDTAPATATSTPAPWWPTDSQESDEDVTTTTAKSPCDDTTDCCACERLRLYAFPKLTSYLYQIMDLVTTKMSADMLPMISSNTPYRAAKSPVYRMLAPSQDSVLSALMDPLLVAMNINRLGNKFGHIDSSLLELKPTFREDIQTTQDIDSLLQTSRLFWNRLVTAIAAFSVTAIDGAGNDFGKSFTLGCLPANSQQALHDLARSIWDRYLSPVMPLESTTQCVYYSNPDQYPLMHAYESDPDRLDQGFCDREFDNVPRPLVAALTTILNVSLCNPPIFTQGKMEPFVIPRHMPGDSTSVSVDYNRQVTGMPPDIPYQSPKTDYNWNPDWIRTKMNFLLSLSYSQISSRYSSSSLQLYKTIHAVVGKEQDGAVLSRALNSGIRLWLDGGGSVVHLVKVLDTHVRFGYSGTDGRYFTTVAVNAIVS
eukprot:GHVQ01014851.1.p1 GENE.GHVQ01014851.1~~GHVQ01014851.1.p1  ORF type:complete len:905 (+),score=106.69 GHVQ01014851.1:336-3050(+)